MERKLRAMLLLALVLMLPSVGLGRELTFKILEESTQVATKSMTVDADVGIFAYLTVASATTCTLANTHYFVNGAFDNAPSEGFSVGTAGITLTNGPGYYVVQGVAALASNKANVGVTLGIQKNGALVTEACMCNFIRNVNENYNMSTNLVLWLNPGDSLSLSVAADVVNTVVTFTRYNVMLHKFLR